ncbi:MAG TPA: FecR domain-containing protein [Candidatus Omnitrophota bacterium]|nr:FecR domain-containing protein [Candidatus Omnitrophota bacterium]
MPNKTDKYMMLIGVLIITVCISGTCFAAPVIVTYQGDVKVVRANSKVGYQCTPKMQLKGEDWISTGENSYVIIAFDDADKNRIKMDSNSIAVIKGQGSVMLEMISGELLVSLGYVPAGSEFSLKTPSGVCTAHGTGWYMATDGFATEIQVFEHCVQMRGINKDGSLGDVVEIPEGNKCITRKYESPALEGAVPQTRIEELRSFMVPDSGAEEEIFLDGSVPTAYTSGDRNGIIEMNGVGINVDAAPQHSSSNSNESR